MEAYEFLVGDKVGRIRRGRLELGTVIDNDEDHNTVTVGWSHGRTGTVPAGELHRFKATNEVQPGDVFAADKEHRGVVTHRRELPSGQLQLHYRDSAGLSQTYVKPRQKVRGRG